MQLKSTHTRHCLTLSCQDVRWLTDDDGRRFFACVREIISNYQSRRDVVLDLGSVVLISLETIEQLLLLKQTLREQDRHLAIINIRPLVAETLRNISVSDLLDAGHSVLEEPVALCPSEALA
ncbi:MAG: STAS domain-containing protein [Planctomycetota bacterium]